MSALTYRALGYGDSKTYITPKQVLKSSKKDGRNWAIVPLIKTSKNNKKYLYVTDRQTGEMYWSDPRMIVRMKSFVGALAQPFVTTGRMFYYPMRSVINIVRLSIRFFSSLISKQKASSQKLSLKSYVKEVKDNATRAISKTVSSFVLGAFIEMFAVYGVFKPYTARKWIAMFEKELNDHHSYKESFHNLGLTSETKAFYLFWCFQPRGNLYTDVCNASGDVGPIFQVLDTPDFWKAEDHLTESYNDVKDKAKEAIQEGCEKVCCCFDKKARGKPVQAENPGASPGANSGANSEANPGTSSGTGSAAAPITNPPPPQPPPGKTPLSPNA